MARNAQDQGVLREKRIAIVVISCRLADFASVHYAALSWSLSLEVVPSIFQFLKS